MANATDTASTVIAGECDRCGPVHRVAQYKSDFSDKDDHFLLISALGSSFAKDQQSNFDNAPTFGDGALTERQLAVEKVPLSEHARVVAELHVEAAARA